MFSLTYCGQRRRRRVHTNLDEARDGLIDAPVPRRRRGRMDADGAGAICANAGRLTESGFARALPLTPCGALGETRVGATPPALPAGAAAHDPPSRGAYLFPFSCSVERS